MTPNSKDKLKVSLLIIICLAVIGIFFIYPMFSTPEASGMYTNAIQIVQKENTTEIANMQKHNESYAIKINEGSTYYLKVFDVENNSFKKMNFYCNKKQFDKIQPNKTYWFSIRFKNDKSNDGTIEDIFNNDPNQ